jgi:hypothetical protein
VVAAMMVTTPLVFALAAFGLAVTGKRWRDLLFVYLIIALTLVQSIVFYGIPRFRTPLEPLLILLGAGALWQLANVLRSYKRVSHPRPDPPLASSDRQRYNKKETFKVVHIVRSFLS